VTTVAVVAGSADLGKSTQSVLDQLSTAQGGARYEVVIETDADATIRAVDDHLYDAAVIADRLPNGKLGPGRRARAGGDPLASNRADRAVTLRRSPRGRSGRPKVELAVGQAIGDDGGVVEVVVHRPDRRVASVSMTTS